MSITEQAEPNVWAVAEAEKLGTEAMVYVWGWQDARGESDDWNGSGVESHAFGRVYRDHALMFALGFSGMRHCIKTMFVQWRRSIRYGGTLTATADQIAQNR